jgi:ubiquinone/menaquinone biosynthesis C-methylase UbiE
MIDQAGSYKFNEFNSDEYNRLIEQGSATWEYEKKYLEWAGLRTGNNVIDIGCGPGVISKKIADDVGTEGFVTGVDINDELLATARAIKSNNSEFQRASVYDLSAFKEQYDFAYVRLLFQHLDNPHLALREISSVLKPNGKICVLDSDESVFNIYPCHEKLWSIIQQSQALQAERGGNRFVGSTLGGLLSACGFKDIEPQIFVMTPEIMGKETFLNVTLGFRPLLFPESEREEVRMIVDEIIKHAMDNMTYGHNGSFIVKGVK